MGEYLRMEEDSIYQNAQWIEIIPKDKSWVNVRENPGKEARVVKKIYLKNRFRRLDEKSGWTKIELLDGSSGWVSNQLAKQL